MADPGNASASASSSAASVDDDAMTLAGVGALMVLLAIAIGAAGAHLLHTEDFDAVGNARLAEDFQTGVRYQMIMGLGVIAAAWLTSRGRRPARLGGWLICAGASTFSASLYVVAMTGGRIVGVFTPIGGVMMMTGWAMVIAAAWRRPS